MTQNTLLTVRLNTEVLNPLLTALDKQPKVSEMIYADSVENWMKNFYFIKETDISEIRNLCLHFYQKIKTIESLFSNSEMICHSKDLHHMTSTTNTHEKQLYLSCKQIFRKRDQIFHWDNLNMMQCYESATDSLNEVMNCLGVYLDFIKAEVCDPIKVAAKCYQISTTDMLLVQQLLISEIQNRTFIHKLQAVLSLPKYS